MEKKKIDTRAIEEEYMAHSPEDDDMLYWTKEALKHELSPLERKIYVTWLELETYTATAQEFNVSVPTVKTYIKALNARISEYICKHIK